MIKHNDLEWGWGVVINFTKKKVQIKRKKQADHGENEGKNALRFVINDHKKKTI